MVPTTTLALDALGRPLTRTTGSSVDTYSYLGTTDTVVRIANTGGTGAVTDSISDPAGDRLGTKTGSTVAWLTPDLHGSIAAGLAQTAGSVTDAIRYDGYGQTVAVWPSGGSPATSSWKYQGRLDLSPSSIPLYAAGARDYAPGLGMFTSLDTFAGSAQDPLSMNRFLYAEANPATLIDPSGHMAQTVDGGGSDPATEAVCHYGCGPTISATDTVREAASHSVANRTYAATVMAPLGPTLDPTAGMTDAAIACMRATPQYAGYCRAQGYGQGSPGGVDQMLAFYGGVCDSTVCGLVDMAMHPDQAVAGLAIAAANGLSPGLVDLIAPDYSIRAQMTAFAARMNSSDPGESARATGQLTGMALALLLPFKALRGGGASVARQLARAAEDTLGVTSRPVKYGVGWRMPIPAIEDGVLRVMERSGRRSNYWRIAVGTKGAVDRQGQIVNDIDATHHPIGPGSLGDILDTIARYMASQGE